jgi:hypothetical protein
MILSTLPKQPDDPSYGYDTRINPIYDVETLDIRCNRGGSTAGAGVQTAKLQAGDMVGFGRTTNASFPNNGYEVCINLLIAAVSVNIESC